jgi:hypothetical protein
MRRLLLLVCLAAALVAMPASAGAVLSADNALAAQTASDVTYEPVALALASYAMDKPPGYPAGMPPYPCTIERNRDTWCDPETGQEWQCRCWYDSGGTLHCQWYNRVY